MSISDFKKFLVKEFSEDIKNEISYLKQEKNQKMIDKIKKAFGIN